MVWNQEGWFLQLHSYFSRLLWLFGVFSVSIRIVKISNKGIINQIQSSQPFQTGIWLPMAFLAHSCLQGWGSVSMLSGKTDTEDEPVKTWMLCSGSKMTFTLCSLHIFWPLCAGVSGNTRLTWWWCMSMLMLIANRVNIIPITIVIRWNWQLCHYKLLFWPGFSIIYYTDFALVLPRTVSFIFQCLFGRFLSLEFVQSIIFPE